MDAIFLKQRADLGRKGVSLDGITKFSTLRLTLVTCDFSDNTSIR